MHRDRVTRSVVGAQYLSTPATPSAGSTTQPAACCLHVTGINNRPPRPVQSLSAQLSIHARVHSAVCGESLLPFAAPVQGRFLRPCPCPRPNDVHQQPSWLGVMRYGCGLVVCTQPVSGRSGVSKNEAMTEAPHGARNTVSAATEY